MEYNGMIYPNTVLVQSVESAQTAAGTSNPTYSTRIAALSCSVQGKNLQTTNSYNKETLVNVFKLYTPNNATSLTIDESDRVVFGTKTFEITGIKDGAGRGHHLEIDMLEVD
jgi:hypothetical protein